MSLYTYRAVNEKGENLEGEIEASSREEVLNDLNQKKFLVTSLKAKDSGAGKSIFGGPGGNLGLIDRYIFFEDLATMMKAGMSLHESLKILGEDAEKKSVQRLIAELRTVVEKGAPLSSALGKYPNLFSSVVVNLVKAGESSGNLEKTLFVIATQFKKDNELRGKIISAMVYPAILMALSTGVIFFMFIFVVPKLNQFFTQAHMQLPPLTRAVVTVGNLVSRSPILDLIIFAILLTTFIILSRTRKGKDFMTDMITRFPLTKKLFRQLMVHHYCWTMGVLIGSGIGILEALDITRDVLFSKSHKEAMQRIHTDVSGGISLGTALRKEKDIFPHIVSGMTIVSEQTGNIEEMYLTLARFYERNFSSSLKMLVTLMEPIMLILMGGVVGVIALAVILPIYQFVSGGVA